MCRCKNDLLFPFLAPIALLLCCRGCEVVEGFTVNLTHILRYHGVNAISDLFEENEIREKGISVYLESKLRQADTVILVCTEGEWTEVQGVPKNVSIKKLLL